MNRILLATAIALIVALPASAEDKKEEGKTEPKGVPLELKLVAKKTAYPLDLGGKKGADFRKQVEAAEKAGEFLPPAPTVEMTLELKNTGTKDLQVWIGGDAAFHTFKLEGPGAAAASFRGGVTAEFRLPKTITLAPGKTHEIPVKQLSHGGRGLSNVYWVEPGEYTLTASYRTAVSPRPEGSEEADKGFGFVTVTAAPVKIKVEEKK